MNTQKQIFLIIVLSFVLVGGCAAYATIDLPVRAERQADFFESESIERGALLYANNCRTCHGIDGGGGVGLPLNKEEFRDQSPLVLSENQELIRRTITCGRAGTLMPAWLIENGGALTDNQIEHLVRMFTAPEEAVTVDGEEFPNEGWAAAREFAHNLNAGSTAVVGGDTLGSIAAAHNTDARAIAELNSLPFEVLEDGSLVLTTDSDDPLLLLAGETNETGLLPGSTLALPEGSTYNAVSGDSLQSIADAHGISVNELEDLNEDVLQDFEVGAPDEALPLEDEEGEAIPLTLELPPIEAYVVSGQSLGDVAATLSNVTAESLAEANGIAPDAVAPVGKVLAYPEDAWGTAPPDTINDGAACVQHVVAQNIYDEITGANEPPARPEQVSTEILVQSHGNDWTVTADGNEMPPNEGVVLMATGTEVTFENVEGVHTITVDEETRVETGAFPVGTTTTLTFDTAGEYDILCDIHPSMFAYFYVADAP